MMHNNALCYKQHKERDIMKSIHNKNEEIKKLPYPKLMISNIGNIVLFTEYNVGTILVVGKTYCSHKIGENVLGWDIDSFTDLPIGEIITLENN